MSGPIRAKGFDEIQMRRALQGIAGGESLVLGPGLELESDGTLDFSGWLFLKKILNRSFTVLTNEVFVLHDPTIPSGFTITLESDAEVLLI